MKRFILEGAVLLTVVACHDATSPSRNAPVAAIPNELASITPSAVTQLFAVVDINGNMTAGTPGSHVTWLGTGQYEVSFNRDVRQCAYVATSANAHSQALNIFTASGHLSSQGVFIETKNQGGGLTNGALHLVVTCGDTGIPFAVVGYSANLVRASAGVSMSFLGAGRYTITFPTSVAPCAYIATVGDPGNALVFSPTAVYTASGSNSKTVYIETKNPGGGLQDGVPFHLAVVCNGVTKTRYAVVKANGVKARASTGTTTSSSSIGHYNIATNRLINACATVATRGSIGSGVPFTPATVEIIPGSSANAIGVEVRNLLGFGGAFLNQPVHVATGC
jgi:hypothetical protein